MQVSKGQRGRGRGRGGSRGGAGTKSYSDDEHNKRDDRKARFAGSSANTLFAAGTVSQQVKAQATQPSSRNRQLRGNKPLNAAPRPNGTISNGHALSSSHSNGDQTWRDPTIEGNASYTKRMSELYQTLKKNREKERKDAIRDGVLADPDKPTSLALAITPVGTCQDMCPEFERVERIVQLMVDGCEKTPSRSADGKDVPWEDYMVKRFRRSAAGYDEQLPSDIRPPIVLQQTLDYLLDEVIGGPQALANVHKFVWDRTRGIRNDFSIQQVTRATDLRIAIDCFERIARFHILSLHQLSRPGQNNGEFDHHQEREQLNNTLLSLMYYYDDSRHKLKSTNEAEFRAYCIIFEIQDQRPDLEDRSQNWPRDILKDRRVQTALKLYAAAGNTADEQGPLRPRTPNVIAQANYGKVWSVVASNTVSYLMACAAEIYFNLIRKTALESIWKAYKRGGSIKMEDWTLSELVPALGFDEEEQVQTFCEEHGFTMGERADGESFLNLSSVPGSVLSDSSSRRKQIFSRTLVESKRLDRTLSAVIKGVSASDAVANGMVEKSSSEEKSILPKPGNDSLFITDDSDDKKPETSAKPNSNGPTHQSTVSAKPKPFSSVFDSTSQQSIFGTPTAFTTSANPFGAPLTSTVPSTNSFEKATNTSQNPDFFGASNPPTTSDMSLTNGSPFATKTKPSTLTPSFNFFQPSATEPNASVSAELGSKTIFGLPSTATATPASSNIGDPAIANDSRAKNTTGNSSRPATSTSLYSNPPQTTASLFQFNSPQQAPTKSPFSFNPPQQAAPKPPFPFDPPQQMPAKSPFSFDPPQQAPAKPPFSFDSPRNTPMPSSSSQTSLFSPTSTFEISSQTPPAVSHLSSPTKYSSTLVSTLPPQPMQAAPGLSFTNFPPANRIPLSTTPSASSQPIRPPQATKSVLKPASSSSVPLKSIEASRFTNSLTNTKPKVSSPLAKPAITPSNVPERYSPSKENERGQVRDRLAKTMMLEPEGLLKQFIEHTVGPIILAAFDQVQDEQSWQIAGEVRERLLGRRYIRRWKAIAWRLGLLRKGRERRRVYAQSMQSLAVDSKRRRSADLGSEGLLVSTGTRRNNTPLQEKTMIEVRSMPPPEKPQASQRKRKSLDRDPGKERDFEMEEGSQQLRHEQISLANGSTTRSTKAFKGHHKRSKTLGNFSATSTGHHSSSSNESPLGASSRTSGSIFNSSILSKTRQLIPNGRMDATHTSYFRLKAMGIDPTTMSPSVIPASQARRKRARDDEREADLKKTPRLTPPEDELTSFSADPSRPSLAGANGQRNTEQNPRKPFAASVNDEDEQLFAQMRSVRDAMSESICWFQDERAKSEFSRSSSRDETGQTARTGTFTSTPSRTEQRLARTGGHGLATKEVVKRSSTSEGKKPEYGSCLNNMSNNNMSNNNNNNRAKGVVRQGFATISGEGDSFTSTRGTASPAQGTSIDDAIEL